MIRDGLVELLHQVREGDKSSVVAIVDGMDQKGCGQTGFAGSRGAHENDIPAPGHIVEGIIYVDDFFRLSFGCRSKGKVSITSFSGIFACWTRAFREFSFLI